MATQTLSDDCIYYIIKLCQNERSILYNFSSVNNFCCNAVIPLLYKNPFHNVQDSLHYYLLARTYLTCLNKKERNHLNFNFNINIKPSSLFEYVTYLEEFSKSDLQLMNIYYKIYQKKGDVSLMETFYHLFLRQGKKLKSLEILTELLDQSLFNTEFIDTIILNNLVNVKTLTIRKRQHFDIPLFVHFLKKLSNDYNEIKFFNHKYETFNFSPLIKNLILKQRQLTKFKINSESYFSKINTRTKLQFDNLVSLTLINMNLLMISFDNFNNFNNLKELIFNNCEEMSDIQRNKLTKAPYNLKTLGLGKWSARTIELLIKTFGSSLKKLLVGTITIEIINIVSLYCSELVTFKILDNITSIHFPSFPILKKIKIKKLTFLFCDSSLIEPSIFLKNIAIHFPESISNLCLFYNEILSADKLETILYNTKPSLTSLTINCEIDNNCLQVILDYVKIRKSTKILKLKIQVNISKLDLLARNVLKNLREQGVDVQLLII